MANTQLYIQWIMWETAFFFYTPSMFPQLCHDSEKVLAVELKKSNANSLLQYVFH